MTDSDSAAYSRTPEHAPDGNEGTTEFARRIAEWYAGLGDTKAYSGLQLIRAIAKTIDEKALPSDGDMRAALELGFGSPTAAQQYINELGSDFAQLYPGVAGRLLEWYASLTD